MILRHTLTILKPNSVERTSLGKDSLRYVPSIHQSRWLANGLLLVLYD